MRHFKIGQEVFGYDENDKTQIAAMTIAMEAGAKEIFDWPPSQTACEISAHFSAIAQSFLDAGAMAWGYHNILSAVSYVNSKNKKFKAEAQALLHWRDEVWSCVHENSAKIDSAESMRAILPPQPERPQ